METNNNQFFFKKCVYVALTQKIIDTAKRDESRSGTFVHNSDWTEAVKALAEATECGRTLTMLVSNVSDSSNIRWIAIIDAIEVTEGKSAITFAFLDELEIPILSSALHRYGRQNNCSDEVVTLCESTTLVNNYLNANEKNIFKNYNELFFEKCVYVSLDKKMIEDAEFNNNAMGKFINISDCAEVSNVLAEARKNGKILNIIFGEEADSLSVNRIAIIDTVEMVGQSTAVTFGFIEELTTPISVSTLRRYGGSRVLGDGVIETYTICDSPWFLNVSVEFIFGETSLIEFKNALLAANVTTKQREMLNHNYQAPEHAISMETMARLMGYNNSNDANSQYGKFAGLIAEHMGYPVESNIDSITTLAFPSEMRDRHGHLQWKMRLELVLALKELGWVVEDLEPATNC
jgi:hypothetical protein